MPQYQKSVVKSRTSQLQLAVGDIAKAQQRFQFENNAWPADFETLDISFDGSFPDKVHRVYAWSEYPSTNSVRANNQMSLILWPGSAGTYGVSLGLFNTNQKYSGSGFAYVSFLPGVTAGMYCVETVQPSREVGDFCQRVVGLSSAPVSFGLARFFPL